MAVFDRWKQHRAGAGDQIGFGQLIYALQPSAYGLDCRGSKNQNESSDKFIEAVIGLLEAMQTLSLGRVLNAQRQRPRCQAHRLITLSRPENKSKYLSPRWVCLILLNSNRSWSMPPGLTT